MRGPVRSHSSLHGRRPVLLALALLTALSLIAAACSDSDDGGDGEEAEGTTTTTLPPCDEEDTPAPVEPVGSTASGDLVVEASVEAGPNSVLTGVLAVETTSPTSLVVTASSGDEQIAVPVDGDPATERSVPILGLTAETDYAVTVEATADDGTTETAELTYSSGSLPTDLPPLETTVSEPALMAPGVTLFNARWWGVGDNAMCQPTAPEDQGWLLAVDATGEVVWYYRSLHEVTDVSPTPRGTLLVSMHDVLIREIDMLGNTVSELGTLVATDYAPTDFVGNTFVGDDTVPTEIDSAHHELYELDNGNLLTLSTEVIELDPEEADGLCDGAEDEDGNPVDDPAGVVGDVVVEITPEGEVVQEWPLSDYFDPIERPGAEMCVIGNPIAPPNWFYPDEGDLRDWTHANAAVVDEATNTLLVSIRHLDAVIGIRYADDENGPAGELLWDLSPDGTLELTSGEYALHGHAVEPEPDGTILYYDNGNLRPDTTHTGGDEPNYSRAVLYRIDPDAGTAEQVWEHRDVMPDGMPQFAGFLSDADRLPNGNVLITHGGTATEDNVFYSRIVEVVPDYQTGEDTIVFDLYLGDREDLGFTAYRADRLPSLYFGTDADTPDAAG